MLCQTIASDFFYHYCSRCKVTKHNCNMNPSNFVISISRYSFSHFSKQEDITKFALKYFHSVSYLAFVVQVSGSNTNTGVALRVSS